MRFMILLLTLLLTGCATTSSSYYKSAVNSWRGANSSTLIKRWGMPNTQIKNPDGHITYIYRTVNQTNENGYVQVVRMGKDGKPMIINVPNTAPVGHRRRLSNTCLAIFDIDRAGMITDTQVRGTHCSSNVSFRQPNPSAYHHA